MKSIFIPLSRPFKNMSEEDLRYLFAKKYHYCNQNYLELMRENIKKELKLRKDMIKFLTQKK